MKITLCAGQLVEALEFVFVAVPKRPTIPILSHAKIAIADGKLTIMGNDCDIELSAEINANEGEPGSTTVPCSRLKKLFDELPRSAEVTLAQMDGQLRVTSGRGHWSLPTLPIENFPRLDPPNDGAVSFVVPREETHRLIKRVGFAVSTEEVQRYLNGIFLTRRRGKLTAAATDGHRLAETVLELDPGSMPDVIVPPKAVDALNEIARTDHVAVQVTGTRIEFGGNGRRVVSKLIDGVFPDYARLLPDASKNVVTASAAAVLDAIKRLNAVAEATDSKAIGIDWREGSLTLCLAREVGVGIEEIEPINSVGAGRFAAQAHYLLEQLEALDADTLVIDHGGNGSPIRLTRPDEPATTTILMPLTWEKPVAEPVRKRA
jgi:DNA polymerase III subunit beta